MSRINSHIILIGWPAWINQIRIKDIPMISLPLNLFVISMTATPGPANMAHLASGQSMGFKKSLPFLLGNAVGLLIMNISVGFGIGGILQTYPVISTAIRFAGTGYIIFLAYSLIKSSASGGSSKRSFSFSQGILLQFLNPKSWAMSVSAFSQFSDSQMPIVPQILGFALCFLFWQPIAHGLWTAAGVGIMDWLHKTGKRRLIFNITASGLMVGSTVYSLIG